MALEWTQEQLADWLKNARCQRYGQQFWNLELRTPDMIANARVEDLVEAMQRVPSSSSSSGPDELKLKFRASNLIKKAAEAAVAAAEAEGDPTVVGGKREAQDLEGPGGPAYRVLKKHKSSDFADPAHVEVYIPDGDDEENHGEAAFLAGRQVEVAFTTALPAMLLAPEFGVVHDASYQWDRWVPPPWLYKAASELLSLMAKVYANVAQRQKEFIAWHTDHMKFKIKYHKGGSTSSGSSDLHRNADILQGRHWLQDPVICALGVPLLCLDLAGPNLQIHGMYTVDTNRIAAESLTSRIPLLQQSSRQPRQLRLLTATLGGYLAAAAALTSRIAVACGAAAPSKELQSRATEVVTAMTQGLNVQYAEVLKGAVLSSSQVLALSDVRRELAPSPEHAALLLPYTLAAGVAIAAAAGATAASDPQADNFTCGGSNSGGGGDGGSSNSKVESFPCLLDVQPGKLVYAGALGDHPSFVKFTTSFYPSHVHKAWQEHQLVPKLYSSQNLSGGYSYVVMELLDSKDWQRLCDVLEGEYSEKDKMDARQAAERTLEAAHKIEVKLDGMMGRAVHGDCRGPNIMMRRANSGWDVRFVDLDWSGFDGVGRYPPRMSSKIDWHPTAKPGLVLQQVHDVHLLEHCAHEP